MTYEFKIMLDLFRCATHGYECPIVDNVDFLELKKKAIINGVWHTIFNEYKQLFLKKHNDEEAIKYIESENKKIISSIYKNLRKKEVLKSILLECKNQGINCVLLKGFLFADLYAEPDFRISGDIDLYVSEKNESQVVRILEKYDFKCTNRLKSEYHSECINNNIGLIELHVSLYDNYCKELWFDNENGCDISEPFEEIETIDGCKYTVLGYTDNYIFSVLHFIKHFIGGGVGIRQLMDIMLFAKKYKSKIDIDKYVDMMHSMKYDFLMDVMSYISVKHLGFSAEDLIFCRGFSDLIEYEEDILDIIEEGGMFGKYSTEENGFSEIYTQICLKNKGNKYSDYIKENMKKNGILKSIFVSPEQMSDKYSYAKKKVYLLPLAWGHRLINGYFSLKKVENLKNDNKKLHILKKLKLLDD